MRGLSGEPSAIDHKAPYKREAGGSRSKREDVI